MPTTNHHMVLSLSSICLESLFDSNRSYFDLFNHSVVAFEDFNLEFIVMKDKACLRNRSNSIKHVPSQCVVIFFLRDGNAKLFLNIEEIHASIDNPSSSRSRGEHGFLVIVFI